MFFLKELDHLAKNFHKLGLTENNGRLFEIVRGGSSDSEKPFLSRRLSYLLEKARRIRLGTTDLLILDQLIHEELGDDENFSRGIGSGNMEYGLLDTIQYEIQRGNTVFGFAFFSSLTGWPPDETPEPIYLSLNLMQTLFVFYRRAFLLLLLVPDSKICNYLQEPVLGTVFATWRRKIKS